MAGLENLSQHYSWDGGVSASPLSTIKLQVQEIFILYYVYCDGAVGPMWEPNR